MRTPVTLDSAPHQRSKPIPLNTRLPWHQIASITGAGRRRFVPEANLAEQDEVPDLLDFSIDIEQLLAGSDSLQPARLTDNVLKFEVPLHRKESVCARLVNSSNSTGAAAKLIEFRRPERKVDRR
jgi:hypothetical protein